MPHLALVQARIGLSRNDRAIVREPVRARRKRNRGRERGEEYGCPDTLMRVSVTTWKSDNVQWRAWP